MDKSGAGFKYLKSKFPRLSDAKIKEGVFVGPQIRDLLKDENFERTLKKNEKRHGKVSVYMLHIFWEM